MSLFRNIYIYRIEKLVLYSYFCLKVLLHKPEKCGPVKVHGCMKCDH